MGEVYDKKKLIILRAILIALGAALCGTGMWQYFVYYPDLMRQELSIVVIVVSAAVGAALFGLSAKPFYRLGASIGAQFEKTMKELGAKGVTAVVAGLFTAGIVGFLFDFLIRDGVDIIAVRVLLDAAIVAIFAALCCYGFVKWMAADEPEEGVEKHETAKSGYLLTASCFFDDRVYVAASVLCPAKVTTDTFKAVWNFGDSEALSRLKTVTDSGAAIVISTSYKADGAEEYARREADTAALKRLMPVCAAGTVFPEIDGAVSTAVFTEAGDYKAKLEERAKAAHDLKDDKAAAESGEKVEETGDEVGGKIIIDK